MSSDSDKTPPGSLWQPVSSGTIPPGKVTDVTPEPIKSSSSTVSAGPSSTTSKPSAASSAANPPRVPSSESPKPPGPSSFDRPRRSGALGGLLVGLILAAIVLAALYLTAPNWLPGLVARAGIGAAPTSTPAPVSLADADRQKLEAQFADINARIAALKNASPIPSAPDSATADQVKQLQAQLQQITKEQADHADVISQLTARQNSDASKPAADPAIAERLDAAQKQIDALTAASNANKTLRGDFDALNAELSKANERNTKLEQRLAELEKTLAAQQNVDQRSVNAARASALMALAARLRSNVEAGRGFANDLAAFKPLTSGDMEMAALLTNLEPLSGGTDGVAALRQSFPPVARAIVTAANSDAAGDWLDRTVARLSSIVSVRRVGDNVTGDSPEARVARAEAALNAGKLDVAVAELKPLTGKAAQAAAPWLAKAERQLAAIAAADKLQALAGARLAQIEQTR
jgi:hypothetical protein